MGGSVSRATKKPSPHGREGFWHGFESGGEDAFPDLFHHRSTEEAFSDEAVAAVEAEGLEDVTAAG